MASMRPIPLLAKRDVDFKSLSIGDLQFALKVDNGTLLVANQSKYNVSWRNLVEVVRAVALQIYRP